MKAVLVASGGMDSAVMAYFYKDKGYDLHLVGFDYGQKHGANELLALKTLGVLLDSKVDVIDLKGLQGFLNSALTSPDIDVPEGHYREATMSETVVPNRNAIMISIATGIAVSESADIVAIGIQGGLDSIYPDCRPEFLEPLGKAIEKATEGKIQLEVPLLTCTKADVALFGSQLSVPFEITWSCYKGEGLHCGRCGTCIKRIEGFLVSGVTDPTEYENGIDFAIEQLREVKK